MKTESILDFQVTSEDIGYCIDTIISWIDKSKKSKYFVCANPHSLHIAESDPVFKDAIKKADLVIPDGVGILLASKINNGSIKTRITGSDVFKELSVRFNQSNKYSVFFLGSSNEVLNKISDKFKQEYPNVQLVGLYSPPYKSFFSDDDLKEMIAAINDVKPDVLWVGMTAPKQEKWIYQNIDKLEVKFAGAIGAVFDFYIGNVKRSHPIFQKIGLEWLPRLLQEPRRLWRRNFVSNPLFIYKVLKFSLKN